MRTEYQKIAQVFAILCALASVSPAQEPAPAGLEPTPPQATAELTNKVITPEQARELVRRAMEVDLDNYKKQKDLTHVERAQTDQLNKDGTLKKSESVTREILILYGARVERVLDRNDKPLTGDALKKEQEKFDKRVAKLQNESPKDRQKRIDEFEEQSEKAREFVRQVADAYNFKFLGEEMVADRPAYVIAAEPQPGFEPNSRETKILSKMRGRMWIDIASNYWLKIDAEFTDTISFGLFLARVRRGTRVQVEQTLFRDEVWVPRKVQFKLDARIALFKQMFANVDVTFRDWRKFSSDSKITDVQEITSPPNN